VIWPDLPRRVILDVATAVVTSGIEIGLIVDGSIGISWQAVTLTVLAGVLLLFRRPVPLLVLAGTGLLATLLAVRGDYPAGAPVLVALFTVADQLERRISLVALVPTMVLLQATSISSPPVSIGAWALGLYLQTRRRYTTALEQRADQLEREREQLSRIAVQEERASIARELHDIVAHSVTVMLLGVRGARDVLHTSPDVAADTLRRVESSAEQSIDELRRMLQLLRGPDQALDVSARPGLAQLDELVEGYRKIGLPVRLELEGEQRSLPEGIELSVYRIVEEALTNVAKHAAAVEVLVRLGFGTGTLRLRIENDGPAVAAAGMGAGHGILGMRERVMSLGGDFGADPIPEGGFRVDARLPIGNAG
jgi:signal transduction histidine kinase